ncbi:MAG: hypothetical protein EU541_04400 [Promethearchaeota archaeon]|nr:MAG: hypothetical protein EU541_04400 [Candidatus Lokiarchaeota archaeon]
MQLKLIPLQKVVRVGDKVPIRSKFEFEEDNNILWSGVRLVTSPPCKRDFLIAQKEIFSNGYFEAGEYIREKAITLKKNVVPTIKKRDLIYNLELILRKPNPINEDEDLLIKRKEELDIRPQKTALQKSPNPISFSISGLNVELKKDIFKPGETIKLSYSSEELDEIEVRLLQKANLICHCAQYGRSCQQVEELPPAIAGKYKTRITTKEGNALLKVPEVAEPSHNYLWEPSEKEHWDLKLGDYTQWSLLITAHKKPEFGKEKIEFELPITISSKPITEKREGSDLFAGSKPDAFSLFEGVTPRFEKRFELIGVEFAGETQKKVNIYKVKIKNISEQDLEGATIKLSGLQEGLFETAPHLIGFKDWNKGEVKEVEYRIKQNISALVSIIEDNSHRPVRTQKPV